MGCKIAVSTAINWFFENENEGIILEDDCLPSKEFYEFCSLMLDKYRSNSEIGSITGTKISPFNRNYNNKYFASKYPNVWGWATWKRVWDRYDVELKNWESEWEESSVDSYLDNSSVAEFWRKIFYSVYGGEVDTWDYQLIFLFLKNRYKCIVPNKNLIENIGFDEEATHTIKNGWISSRKIENFTLDDDLLSNSYLELNRHYDFSLEKFAFGIHRLNLFQRLFRVIYSKIVFYFD